MENVIDYEMIGFVIGFGACMLCMAILKSRDVIYAYLYNLYHFERIDLFELLDTVEEKYTWTLDDLAAALLHDKPRVSNLALELAFAEPDYCEPSWRVHFYAFLLGAKERAEEWWAKFKDGWIIEHGSNRARDRLAVRRMKDELEENGWRWL